MFILRWKIWLLILCLLEGTTAVVWFKIKIKLHLPGTEVPRATNTTAVTESFRPTVQPKWEARSPVKYHRKNHKNVI